MHLVTSFFFSRSDLPPSLPELFFAKLPMAGGDQGSLARLERGEITLQHFGEEISSECSKQGVNVSGREITRAFASAPRPEWLATVDALRFVLRLSSSFSF